MKSVRSSQELATFIQENGLTAEILPMTEPTPTVADAARVLNVPVDKVIKSLVLESPQGPLLVVARGTARIEPKLLAAHLGLPKRRVKMAKPDATLAYSGFVVGSMPPFGHLEALPTFIDAELEGEDFIYGGGGDVDSMLRFSLLELMELSSAEFVKLR